MYILPERSIVILSENDEGVSILLETHFTVVVYCFLLRCFSMGGFEKELFCDFSFVQTPEVRYLDDPQNVPIK